MVYTTKVTNSPAPNTPSSPRKRPQPFTSLITPSHDSSNGGGGSTSNISPTRGSILGYEAYDTNNTSPGRSPGYYLEIIEGVQKLYTSGISNSTGTDSTSSRTEVEKFVRDNYDGSATFENLLVLTKGKEAIVDLFCLTELVPGCIWSELGEVFENIYYDGGRTIHMTQTLHLTLFPSLNPDAIPLHSTQHPSHPLYSSAPPTPHAQGSFAFNPLTTLTSIYTTSVPNHNHHKSQWPLFTLLSNLKPLSILSTLTTFQIKLFTKLILNEQGKIVSHEDTWGIKETLEGFVPVLGYVYELNRNALGFTAGLVSRALFGKTILPSLTPPSTSTTSTISISDDEREEEEAIALALKEALIRRNKLEEIRRGSHTSAFSLFGLGDPLSPIGSRKNSIGSSNAVTMTGYGGAVRRPLLPPLEIEVLNSLSNLSGAAGSASPSPKEVGGTCDTDNDEGGTFAGGIDRDI